MKELIKKSGQNSAKWYGFWTVLLLAIKYFLIPSMPWWFVGLPFILGICAILACASIIILITAFMKIIPDSKWEEILNN